jgi:hypothetical protein
LKAILSLGEVVIFRAEREDREAIDQVSQKLKLTRSEISRRALRLGLEVLDDRGFPGADVRLKATPARARPDDALLPEDRKLEMLR